MSLSNQERQLIAAKKLSDLLDDFAPATSNRFGDMGLDDDFLETDMEGDVVTAEEVGKLKDAIDEAIKNSDFAKIAKVLKSVGGVVKAGSGIFSLFG